MDGNGERVDMMKVLVTGADGMLGRDVMRALREKHVNARGVDMADFDVTDGTAVREWVTAEQPDAIIHSTWRRIPICSRRKRNPQSAST